MAGLTTRAFVGRLAGSPIFDPNGDQLGRIRDVVVMMRTDGSYPRVHGLVVEVPPHRRIFLPMTRVSGLDAGTAIATGLVNMRRFEPRSQETLVVAELLDRRVALLPTGDPVTVVDVAIEQTRQYDWVIRQLFVRRGSSGFRRRGETLTVDIDQVSGLAHELPGQPTDSLLEQIDDMRPADVASMLLDLPFKRQLELTQGLDDDRLADVLEELPDSAQVAILAMLDDERAADVLEEMDPGDAADLLNELTPERAEELLELVEPDDARDLRRLLSYDERSAGGLMTTEPVVLGPDGTVADALARIRNPELPPALAAHVYVVRPPLETPTGKFLGLVHFQRLLREMPGTLVGSLIDNDVESVEPDTKLDVIVRYFARYNLVGLPVTDENDHLLGVVTVDDVVDHMLPENWREDRSDFTADSSALREGER